MQVTQISVLFVKQAACVQVSGSDSADGPWLKAITERVMNIYCERLSGYAWCSQASLLPALALFCIPVTITSTTENVSLQRCTRLLDTCCRCIIASCSLTAFWTDTTVLRYQVDDTSRITSCIDNLAQVLVENLTGRSGNPDLALLADRLLHSMLLRFPQLLWSAPVMQALLVELQREEGALYLSGAKPRLTLARVLRIRRKKKQVPLPAWTWIIRVGIHFWFLTHKLSTSCSLGSNRGRYI